MTTPYDHPTVQAMADAANLTLEQMKAALAAQVTVNAGDPLKTIRVDPKTGDYAVRVIRDTDPGWLMIAFVDGSVAYTHDKAAPCVSWPLLEAK